MMKPNYLRSMVCVAVLALFGCSQEVDTAVAPAASIVRTGAQNEFAQNVPNDAPMLYVTTDAGFPPYDFYDEFGNIVGFDVDLINAIAADQGMKVVVHHEEWSNIWKLISDGNSKSDQLVMGSMGYTPERQAAYELSHGYADAPVVAVVLEDTPVQTLPDLRGKKIALIGGTSALGDLKSAEVLEFDQVQTVSTYLSFKKLVNGEVDAIVDDKFTLQYHMANHPEVKVRMVDVSSKAGYLVFATNKGNTALMAKINRGLDNVRANGTYDKILRKWFGEQATIRTAAAAASQPK